jgi:hypothetical protein
MITFNIKFKQKKINFFHFRSLHFIKKKKNFFFEGKEEITNWENYRPIQRRDNSYQTFTEIKEKTWKISKHDFLKDLSKDPANSKFNFEQNKILHKTKS